MQKEFAQNIVDIIKNDASVIGLAAGGSWITGEMDTFSDLDLVLVTVQKVSESKDNMMAYAQKFGKLLSAFTGDHVGEPRLLICLYDNPLLHVDIKFVTLEEFAVRIENPVVLYDTNNALKQVIERTEASFPHPDFQWIEDRFWTWVHYAAVKIGRGEYFEALDFLSFIRMVVLGPLLHVKNNKLPRGVRKVEDLPLPDFEQLKRTIAAYDKQSLLNALLQCVIQYRYLRNILYNQAVNRHSHTEERVMLYFDEVKGQ